MSNNYTKFCFSLDLSEAQYNYLHQGMKSFEDLASGETCPDEFKQIFAAAVEEHGPVGASTEYENGTATIYTDESGNVEALICVLQQLLNRFPELPPIGFECSFSGSKPRPGDFGGAAYIVTKEEVRSIDTSEWVRDCLGLTPALDIQINGGLVQSVGAHSRFLQGLAVHVIDLDIEGAEEPDTMFLVTGNTLEAFVSEHIIGRSSIKHS